MNFNEKRRHPGRGNGVNAEKSWGVNTPTLPFLDRTVNRSRLLLVVQFRNVLVDGIALIGWPACPWLSRLVNRLTVLADALAEKSGVRA